MDCPLCPRKNLMSKCFLLQVKIRSKYDIYHIPFIRKIILGVRAEGWSTKIHLFDYIFMYGVCKKRGGADNVQLINITWQKH